MYHHTSGGFPGPGARHHHHPFSKHGFKPFGVGMPHGGFPGHPGIRARRGDVRTAVLRLLAEQPMHGYQIIQELAERSAGAWTPSAGSVYPTLQQLADEDLVTAEESGGKKVFHLTEAGRAQVAEMADQPAPWDDASLGDPGMRDYRVTVGKLMQAAFQIGTSGSREQRDAAVEILTEARKKLYALLAED